MTSCFPLLRSHWKKVALVLVKARDSCNLEGLSISYEVLAARLRDLADRNEIEGIGDLRIVALQRSAAEGLTIRRSTG